LECMSFREKALLERDGPALEKLGIGAFLREMKVQGRFAPHWRPLVSHHWLVVAWVVLKSENDSLRAVVDALSEMGLRLKLFSFFSAFLCFQRTWKCREEGNE